jgi:hypothetical protein
MPITKIQFESQKEQILLDARKEWSASQGPKPDKAILDFATKEIHSDLFDLVTDILFKKRGQKSDKISGSTFLSLFENHRWLAKGLVDQLSGLLVDNGFFGRCRISVWIICVFFLNRFDRLIEPLKASGPPPSPIQATADCNSVQPR